MFQIHTSMTPEQARGVLTDHLSRMEEARGRVVGNAFRLSPRSSSREISVTLRGRLEPGLGGTVISAWSAPQVVMIVAFVVWAVFCIESVHAPWFALVGLGVCVFSYRQQTRKGYELLKKIYAA